MSEHAAPAVAAEPGLMQKHHFLLRRLHSLSGIIPVGLFVCMHLFTNASMAGSLIGRPDLFQHEVDFIHSLPALEAIEIALWLSIGFHAVLGVLYMTGAVHNTMKYKYQDNYRYTLQRVTAWIALVFIFLHIATLRWRWDILNWETPFWAHRPLPEGDGHTEVPMALPFTAYALQFSWLVVLFYTVGVLSVVFHWANGLWTAAITWGVTVTEPAMKRWGYICVALGIALTGAFGSAMIGALTYDLEKDTTLEQRLVLDHWVADWRERLDIEPATADVADVDREDDADDHDIHGDEDSDH